MCQHNPQNSWWESDVKGIPLARVCNECIKVRLSGYRVDVLTAEQQEVAFGRVLSESNYAGVEELVEADY